MSIKDLYEKVYVNIETQLGVSVPTGLVAWALELNWVAILSCILILGQIGLLIPKYVVVFREWKKKKQQPDKTTSKPLGPQKWG